MGRSFLEHLIAGCTEPIKARCCDELSTHIHPAQCSSGQRNDQALLRMHVSLFTFFFLSELQEDHSMEVMMRTKEMTVYERITSFYSAPFTKFMGNLVNALFLY